MGFKSFFDTQRHFWKISYRLFFLFPHQILCFYFRVFCISFMRKVLWSTINDFSFWIYSCNPPSLSIMNFNVECILIFEPLEKRKQFESGNPSYFLSLRFHSKGILEKEDRFFLFNEKFVYNYFLKQKQTPSKKKG